MQDVNNKRNFRGWERVYEKSVLHVQFFYKLKTALKKRSILNVKKAQSYSFLLCHCFEESKTIVLLGVSHLSHSTFVLLFAHGTIDLFLFPLDSSLEA